MILRRTKIQLAIFLVITLLGVSFVGARYAKLDRLFYDNSYHVTAHFPASGGIFDNAEVSYRGVKVGQVELDLPTMLARKDKVVKELTGGVAFLFKKYGVTPVYGSAKLLKGNTVEVTGDDGKTTTLAAKNVLFLTVWRGKRLEEKVLQLT